MAEASVWLAALTIRSSTNLSPVLTLSPLLGLQAAGLLQVPVQRESGENAAVYFDLKDPSDFVRKLLDTFNDTGRLKQMSQQGIERATILARKDNYIKKLETLYHAK